MMYFLINDWSPSVSKVVREFLAIQTFLTTELPKQIGLWDGPDLCKIDGMMSLY